MPKKFSFPSYLQRTPEQQSEEDKRQALMLAGNTRARPSEAERLVGRGALLENTARANLDAAMANPEGVNEAARDLSLAQLADSLAMQGKFLEAAEIHPDPVRAEYFTGVATALAMDDSEKCSCPDTEAKMNDVDLAVTPRFESARVYSAAHQGIVSLVRCSVCGHENARPLASRLLKMNAAQSSSAAVGRTVLSDMQVLAKPKDDGPGI